jgi:hypothetical protein
MISKWFDHTNLERAFNDEIWYNVFWVTTLLLLIIVIQPSPEKFLETSDVRPFQIRVIESLNYHSAFIISVQLYHLSLYEMKKQILRIQFVHFCLHPMLQTYREVKYHSVVSVREEKHNSVCVFNSHRYR